MLPLVSEPTVTGDVALVADWFAPPSLEMQVTVKPVSVSPPVLCGVTATMAELSPRVTLAIGARRESSATKGLVAAEATLSPIELVATTVQV